MSDLLTAVDTEGAKDDVLHAIIRNAEGHHHDEAAKARALAVIASWAKTALAVWYKR